MKFVKYYNSDHYTHFFQKIEQIIEKNNNFNMWIKSLKDDKLSYWIYIIISFEKNSKEHYEEYSMLLTLLIRFFILELDIDNEQIELKDREIKKLLNKFKYALYREYSNRNNIIDFINEDYSLLK